MTLKTHLVYAVFVAVFTRSFMMMLHLFLVYAIQWWA